MIQSSPQTNGPSIAFVEFGLILITVALAFAFPALGSAWFRRVERLFSKLARKRAWAVASVGAAAFLLRLAILPICPIPLPFVPDDFSFLLAADTFAHGRLTNPTPAMWTHLESIHITMVPSYMSMYFPATGLVLAAGKAIAGHPWFGLLAVTAMMCAAICWMLQAWLPPTWALLGGIVAILRIGLFSYWINSYNGGGAVAALGGALVLGAFPRLTKSARPRDALLLAIGISILLLSRPYEGMLLCIPVAFAMARWILFGKNRPAPAVLLRRATLPLAVILATGSWLGYYDYRAFGHATTLPYTVDRATYAVMPYFVWQPLRPEPVYRNQPMRTFYTVNETEVFQDLHTPIGLLHSLVSRFLIAVLFYAGFTFIPVLFALPRALLDRRIRLLVLCTAFMVAGMAIQIFLIAHYLAPFTAVFYALGLQAARHLRIWKPGGKAVGRTLLQLSVTLCVLLAGLRLGAQPLHFTMAKFPPMHWMTHWYGPAYFGTERAQVAATLEQLPGKQLVLVRYSSKHNVLDEWVYNDANIDDSKVIWARDMGPSENAEIISYYKDRRVWMVDADTTPAALIPFASAATADAPNTGAR